MKILHIWDNAGVASTIAKIQRQQGHVAHVLTRKGYDRCHINRFYSTIERDKRYIPFALWLASGYDVLHVHSFYKLIPLLRARYPLKLIVMHYHGSDARRKDFKKHICNFYSDIIFYSTVDLRDILPDRAIYFPTPVDTEHFYPRRLQSDEWLGQRLSGKFETMRIVDECMIMDRLYEPVPFAKFPEFLSQYSGYIDVKIVNGQPLQAMSKTGLECLSLGMQVIDFKKDIIRGLPEIHTPNYTKRLLETSYMYDDLP